ncbi:MAG TPA: TMEM165/GDT1 family protein [Kofleriaceae bacterium]|jgi:putative Ca2+/H+ antiporter (TMEM165/GDT1 family)|nr:TMEM165/GDT1 family protein [Kofleriaceae bacterium]
MSIELFATVFGIIFVAELPDKTALSALVLATRHRALPVFLGTGLALSVQSIVAVAAGSLLTRLDPTYVQLGTGLIFLGCAVAMALRKPEAGDEKEAGDQAAGFGRSMWLSFVVIFIAEWGDLTQIGTAALQARYGSWATVLLASVAALWAVTAIAVLIGNRAARVLSPRITKTVAAAVFAVVGVVLVVRAVSQL